MRPIDRVAPSGAGTRTGSHTQQRLDRRIDVALDALCDLRDITAWSDAEVVAVHNTINQAAVTARGGVTTGLARSMPLPMALVWAGA
jgi:hypothetical protein